MIGAAIAEKLGVELEQQDRIDELKTDVSPEDVLDVLEEKGRQSP
jgi:hypothetical protein